MGLEFFVTIMVEGRRERKDSDDERPGPPVETGSRSSCCDKKLGGVGGRRE
jgi:hypothetical protein